MKNGFPPALSALALLALLVVPRPSVADDSVVLDSGSDPKAWTSIASRGAAAHISSGRGDNKGSVGLVFDLGRGRNHVIAERKLSVDLPEDYTVVFRLKVKADINTIELKFLSGENVWWRRFLAYQATDEWKEFRVSRKRMEFAWGPAGGGLPEHLDAIQVAISAGKGGAGEVWVDEVRLEPLDPAMASRAPVAFVSSNFAGSGARSGADARTPTDNNAGLLLDGDASTAWRSEAGATSATVTLDFHQSVEQGGLVVEHAADGYSAAYVVETSNDRVRWEVARRFTRSDGGNDPIPLADVYTRYVRLRFKLPEGEHVAIREIRLQPFEFSSDPNGLFSSMARETTAGLYPRYFSGEQSYWTVVGVSGDAHEALVNEEGSVEVDAGAFSLEPFLWRSNGLRSWKDSNNSVSLADGDLPVPTVVRNDGDASLSITAFAAGEAGASTLYVRYRVAAKVATGPLRLYLALRPFQVLPPWQNLNRTGGASRIERMARDGASVRVDDRVVMPLTQPTAFGAAMFEEGDITRFLARGQLPQMSSVDDAFGYASAALAWDLDLEKGQTRDVWVAVPWSTNAPVVGSPAGTEHPALEALLEQTKRAWRASLDRVPFEFPDSEKHLVESMRSNLAYVLINRDGAAIQPGSRTYERSWIRDGAMTSSALLELGLNAEVKEFVRWYAGFVGKDGWVPCCVDGQGADPVPEHDSFGEFIWSVAEVWRFTRDEEFVREMWPKVKSVAACMTRLRATRMTAEYRTPERRAYFGLLPESISHEGYSARPVHSYWDQAFALRGYADAALLADVVGDRKSAASLGAERDDFEKTLRESIAATMAAHKLDVAPGSVELGDFDPTSTAVSFLLGTEGVYSAKALERSFDRYMASFRERLGKTTRSKGYTAYELRSATVLVLLGRKAEAIEMLEALVADQRPAAWNQWPEISWLWPTEPSFLGDVPHTWIGSAYVHAVRTLLVTERETNLAGDGASLLIGAGIARAWLTGAGEVRARGLPTWYGPLSVRMHGENHGQRVIVTLEAGDVEAGPVAGPQPSGERGARKFEMPEGCVLVAAPFGAPLRAASVDGTVVPVENGGVRVVRLPTTVVFDYKPELEKIR